MNSFQAHHYRNTFDAAPVIEAYFQRNFTALLLLLY